MRLLAGPSWMCLADCRLATETVVLIGETVLQTGQADCRLATETAVLRAEDDALHTCSIGKDKTHARYKLHDIADKQNS